MVVYLAQKCPVEKFALASSKRWREVLTSEKWIVAHGQEAGRKTHEQGGKKRRELFAGPVVRAGRFEGDDDGAGEIAKQLFKITPGQNDGQDGPAGEKVGIKF